MKSILVISRCAAPPYPAAPDFPHPGDRINRSMFSCRNMAPLLNIHSATACGGKVVAPATKGGLYFLARQGGCMVFAAKGGIKNGAEGAVPRQRSDTI